MHLVDLLALVHVAPSPVPPAVFLHSTPFRDLHIFSCVASTGKYESGKRVIVSFQREGRWHCQSCRYLNSCKHKAHAADFARIAGLVDSADEHGKPEDGGDIEASLLLAAGGHNERKHGCISSVRIPPPRWCALPHETTVMIPNPDVFGLNLAGTYFLDSVSRCACGRSIASLSAVELQTAHTVPAIIYGLARRQEVLVEVISCPSCRHARRFIGPDLGACGILNWNNTMLFTHELLDSYTGSFTASETPFSAFCLATRRRYENYSEDMKFCSEETFVRAWFAFIQLQELGGTMACPTCGAHPPVVIADGVSLATHASKLTPNVKPPTYTDAESEEVITITPYKARRLPAIVQKELRSLLTRFLDTVTSTQIPPDAPDISPLQAQYPALCALLDTYVVLPATDGRRRVYKELLSQVRTSLNE